MFTKPLTIFELLYNGIKLYFKNFMSLTECMLFPVFGQLIGIVLILIPVYFYSQNIKAIVAGNPTLNNIS
ncbi:MAG: hypothetical protein WC197_05190, partial [Candidatus Gastranaerophilaceae bacterium]